LTSCDKKRVVTEEKPTVLVSVPPYAFFVRSIAQDAVQIETLVPAGANPHIYEASPKKVLQFFKENRKPIQILDITQGIDLLSVCEEEGLGHEHHHCHHSHDEGHDLHIWLSPKLAKIQAQRIAEALSALLPEHKEQFSFNLNTLLTELSNLDQHISQQLKPFAGKAILVSHPAFGYFCQDYQLTQLSIEIEGKDPLPQHITEILNQVKQYSIQTILIEPQYSNKGAELIASRLGLPTHMVDPYAENYIENLKMIANVVAE
jgi:zinc transport system substrate-binding protein